MNAFDSLPTRATERRSRELLKQFIADQCDEGRYVILEKGPLAPLLQRLIGDYAMNIDGRLWTAEHKAEERSTGNFFLELFSNRCLDDRAAHAEHGMRPGWMLTNRADLLLYHFMDRDELYVLDFFKLKRWAWGYRNGGIGNIWRYERQVKMQEKHAQRNDTVGVCVPISDVRDEIGVRLFHPERALVQSELVL